jgi:hypothetical protein
MQVRVTVARCLCVTWIRETIIGVHGDLVFMPRIRLILSVIAALATLAMSAIYVLGFYDASFTTNVGRESAVHAILLSVITFVLCLKIRSFAVGGLLILAGVLMQLPPVLAIIAA